MIGLAQRFVVLRVVCPLFINFYFSFLSRPNRLCFGSPVRRFVLLVCLCRTCCTSSCSAIACVGFAGSLLVGYIATGRAATLSVRRCLPQTMRVWPCRSGCSRRKRAWRMPYVVPKWCWLRCFSVCRAACHIRFCLVLSPHR